MDKSRTPPADTGTTIKGVLMLVDEFLPLAVDGAERQAGHLAAYMAKRNLWVGVLTRRKGKLSKFERRDGFDVIRVQQFGPGKFKSFTFTLGAIFAIFAQRHAFSVLHAHLAFSPAVAATIAGRMLGKKVIIKFGNSGVYGDVETSNTNWRGRLAMSIFRKWADVCIALSGEMEKEMLGAGFDHSRVVRMVNGVDVHKFSPSVDKRRDRKNLGVEGKKVLLYTGRLTSQKSLKTLLLAFHRSIEVIPNLYLFFVGDGEDRGMLEALAAELGIQDNIAFVRWTEDITSYLRGADIFVLPSLSEGISNSLLEAMAAGLPCIATNVGGSGETLGQNNDYGILVEPGNIDRLAEAIIRLASNDQEALEFGARARQRILEHYDLSVVGDRYFELYEKLVTESRN